MHDRQIEIGDVLLKYLDKKRANTSRDEYKKHLEKVGYSSSDYDLVVKLLSDYNLIELHGIHATIVRIKKDGILAAEIGLKKYLKEIDKMKKLDVRSKTTAIYLGWIGIGIAVLALCISLYSIFIQ